ncbi:hypothetical protein [Candidatus Electronema sp. PJ]
MLTSLYNRRKKDVKGGAASLIAHGLLHRQTIPQPRCQRQRKCGASF